MAVVDPYGLRPTAPPPGALFYGDDNPVGPPLGSGQTGFSIFPAPEVIARYNNPDLRGTSVGSTTTGATVPPSAATPSMTAPPLVGPAQTFASPGNAFLNSLLPGVQHLQGVASPNSNWAADMLAPGPNQHFLTDIAQGGLPFDATPAWQAMVAAQQRNLDQRAADVNERFNTMGGRFSSSYGNAMGDFWRQAGLDQNALLAQLQMASHENASNRRLQAGGQLSAQDVALRRDILGHRAGAAGQLGQMAFGAGSQISTQDFQDYLTQLNQSFQSSMIGANLAGGAMNTLHGTGVTGAQNLFNAMIGAAGAHANTENTAATQLFGAQNQAIRDYVTSQLTASGMNTQAAATLSQQILQRLGLGSSIGQHQFSQQQDAIDRMYQEWMRTQPGYNPLLNYIFQAATAQNPFHFPGQNPSQIGSILGGAGQSLGAIIQLLKLLGIGG